MTVLHRLQKLARVGKLGPLAAAFLVLCELLRRVHRRRPRNVPMVRGHWLLGLLPELAHAARRNQQNEFLHAMHKRVGSTWATTIAPLMPWLVRTNCPKNMEHILKTNFQNYPKGPEFKSRLADLLGNGIFNADGAEWHAQRKISSHMFKGSTFKEHIWVVVRRNARKLRGILEASDPGASVDVFNLMNRFTLDTIGEIGFGKCIGSLEDPSSPFLRSFDRAQQICFWRFINPLWRLMRLFRVGSERETALHLGRLDAYSRSVIHELRQASSREGQSQGEGAGAGGSKSGGVAWADLEARKSFVGLFLEDARRRGAAPLDDDYLRDLVLNFLIAGRDTTAQALSWTLFCLMEHPEAEERTRREVIDVCGVRGPAYEDLHRLPYLQAVVNEALRLYPSVPMNVKTAAHDDVWPDGTFVPRGALVMFDNYSACRDPDFWGEDAEQFRPERWLVEDREPPGNYRYPVFNAGPRECLGRRLAAVEMKTCLAMLLPAVSFRLAVPPDTITTDAQLTIGMGRGLPCFVSSPAPRERLDSNTSNTSHSLYTATEEDSCVTDEAACLTDEAA